MRDFPKYNETLMGFETTLEVARANGWSMERTMAELRVTLHVAMDTESAHKGLALDELKEIKDTETADIALAHVVELDKNKRERDCIDTLLRDYTNIYQELENVVDEDLEGDEFTLEMYRLLKQEYRSIWKEI